MSKRERDKGLLGEREVRHAFESAGFAVRGLNGQGDKLAFLPGRSPLHLEVKRQERLVIPAWARQAEAEAPEGTVPVVIYRRSAEPWRVDLTLQQFLALLQR